MGPRRGKRKLVYSLQDSTREQKKMENFLSAENRKRSLVYFLFSARENRTRNPCKVNFYLENVKEIDLIVT